MPSTFLFTDCPQCICMLPYRDLHSMSETLGSQWTRRRSCGRGDEPNVQPKQNAACSGNFFVENVWKLQNHSAHKIVICYSAEGVEPGIGITTFVAFYQDEPREVSDLCQAFLNLSIEETRASVFIPEESESSSSNGERNEALAEQRCLLNKFLASCNLQEKIGTCKKSWPEASTRTRRKHVMRAKDVVVSAMNVITPGDGALLWEALQSSGLVERGLGCHELSPADQRYLLALTEAYENASGWDTRRQILSIMADIVSFHQLQRYLPGITEYRFKAARQHKLVFGRGVPLPPHRPARMRVDNS